MKKILSISLAFIFLFPADLFPDTTLAELNLPKNILTKTEYYEVYPRIQKADKPGFLKFRITSPHHIYDVEGIQELVKLLHEIEVIERVRQNKDGSGFFDGAASSVVGTGKGFFRLIRHPVESAKGIGVATGKLKKKVDSYFREKDPGEKTTFTENLYGKNGRQIAKKFDVDIYTTNPYLKTIIRKMAESRAIGEGAVMLAGFFIPVGLIGGVVLTTSNTNKFADQIVNDTDRFDLFQQNQEAIIKLGFGLYDVKNLLNHQFYTPREHTYIRFYLEKLKDVPGFRSILKRAIIAKSTLEAHKILREAQIAADSIEKTGLYQEIKLFDEGIVVASEDKVILISGYDMLDEELGSRVLDLLLSQQGQFQKPVAELWVSGKILPEVYSEAQSKKIQARDWLIFEFGAETKI